MLVIVVIVVDDGDSIADNSDDNSVDTSADTSGDKADTDADDADTATHKDGEKLKQNTIDTNIIKAEAMFIDDILLLLIFFP